MTSESKNHQSDSLVHKWLNRNKKIEGNESIIPRPSNIDIPLSLGQQRLFFLQQLNPGNPFYNCANAIRIKGNFNVDFLIRSFEVSAQGHEILRTNFDIKDGKAIQIIRNKPLVIISKHDLRNLAEGLREEQAEKLAFEEAEEAFDLTNGHLSKINIIQLSEIEWLLIVTMHHIIFDKWSLRVFIDEVAENYLKLCQGEQIKASTPIFQYGDYAYWQSKKTQNSKNISYWKNKLENCLDHLELPTDYSRPNRLTFQGAYLSNTFSKDLSLRIKDFAKENKSTLFGLLLTVYKVLLHRYTGENDILVGSPYTNRNQVDLDKVLGFFNDTLVLRSDLSENPRFIEFLEQVKKTSEEALAHIDMPFETLVNILKPNRKINYNPLFQVMFIYQNIPKITSFGDELEIEYQPFDFGRTKFDLTLYISDDNEQISPIFEYSKDLFDPYTIQKMHGHFQSLLQNILDDPNQCISDIPMLTTEELKIMEQYNKAEVELPASNIIEYFEKQVEENPNNTAVAFENNNLSYQELNHSSNSVANFLSNLSMDRSIPLGLYMEPSVDMIVGILGILKAGFAYLPLDSELPKTRLEFILKHSNCMTILTHKSLVDHLSFDWVRALRIEEITSEGNSNNIVGNGIIQKDDLAYVIYTSGSTGNPKGVAVTHENLVSSTFARFDFYASSPKSFLLLSSISFDSSKAGIFWTLATGGKLVLVKRRIEQDIDNLARIFDSESISDTLLLPTLYSALLDSLPIAKLNSLERVIVAGEACPKSLCEKHFSLLPQTSLYNEYGPTEATVWATAYKIPVSGIRNSVPIGQPILNSQIYILDKNKNRVPIGVWGELYIGGKGVAHSYYNNPSLTKDRFTKNYISQKGRLYQTGDLCRFVQDGTIEFKGREDHQVKIRGYRIELEEIQENIRQITNIKDVVLRATSTNKMDNRDKIEDKILKHLKKMDAEEVNKLLVSIENLSDQEVEFIMDYGN